MAAHSKYNAEKHDAAALLSAANGATLDEIARLCEVSVATVERWIYDTDAEGKPKKPTFVEAVERARKTSNDTVKTGLYKNATGQKTVSTTKTVERVCERVMAPKNAKERARLEDLGYIDDEGMVTVFKEKEVEVTVTTEHKGETGAQMAWLCNRVRDEWQHISRIEGNGPGGELTVRIVDDIPED